MAATTSGADRHRLGAGISAAGSGALENQTNPIVLYPYPMPVAGPSMWWSSPWRLNSVGPQADPARTCTPGWPSLATACWL